MGNFFRIHEESSTLILYCLILYDNQRHHPLLEEECEIKKPQFHGSSCKIGEKWRKVKKRDKHSYVIQWYTSQTSHYPLTRISHFEKNNSIFRWLWIQSRLTFCGFLRECRAFWPEYVPKIRPKEHFSAFISNIEHIYNRQINYLFVKNRP